MSNSDQRWSANSAFRIALDMMGQLGDVVERVEIAGSLRRDKQEVGDVELVMTPKFQSQQGLFGETGISLNLLELHCDEMLFGGVVEKRLNKNGHAIAWGERYKALLYRGLPLDIFIVLPDREWGPTMLLRTGPHAANQALVTADGVKNGEGDPGILPKGMIWQEGALWSGGRRVNTAEEIDVFAAVGLPYIPPHERSAESYQRWAGIRVTHGNKYAGGYINQYGYFEIKWRIGETQIAAHVGTEAKRRCSEKAVEAFLYPAEETSVVPKLPALNIADDALKLHPEHFVGQHVAVLGMTGMGKSNCVAVLCEELAPHIQMTIVDLEGEYWSLRDVHPFLVVGRGEHVDQVVSVSDAEALVEEVMKSGQSVILDLYDFDADERNDFLQGYLDRLFEIEGELRRPHIVVLEEAAEFLNQGRKSPVSESAIRLANRGRKRGIGLIMASQRPAALDKNVLNMTRILFLHGVQYPQDIGAYRGALPKDFGAENVARGLAVGQAIVRRTGADGKPRADVYSIRKRRTKDLGATPVLRQQSLDAIPA